MSPSLPASVPWTDLLDQLRETPTRLREITAGIGREMLCTPLDLEGWSMCETVAHLCAVELPCRARLLRMVLEDNPRISALARTTGGFDPDTPIGILLDTFTALRADTMVFLENLPPAARARPALHATRGATTLREEVAALLANDLECLEALSRGITHGG